MTSFIQIYLFKFIKFISHCSLLKADGKLSMFTDTVGKPVCLICGGNVAATKEFNLRRHYKTKHQDKLKYLNAEQKKQKAEEKTWHFSGCFSPKQNCKVKLL